MNVYSRISRSNGLLAFSNFYFSLTLATRADSKSQHDLEKQI